MTYQPSLMRGPYGDHNLNKLRERNLKIGQVVWLFDEIEELLLKFLMYDNIMDIIF